MGVKSARNSSRIASRRLKAYHPSSSELYSVIPPSTVIPVEKGIISYLSLHDTTIITCSKNHRETLFLVFTKADPVIVKAKFVLSESDEGENDDDDDETYHEAVERPHFPEEEDSEHDQEVCPIILLFKDCKHERFLILSS